MRKALYSCFILVLFSCNDKYESEIEYAVKFPNSSNIDVKSDIQKIVAQNDYDAKVKFVEAVIRKNNLMPGSVAFISGKLKKNDQYISTNLSLKTIDSINLAEEIVHRKLNKQIKFIRYEQIPDSINIKY
ncbi:hypothetical protein [Chryseobacterium sp. 2R14A]|uniref:hypothetical protein n=1 Tax=Chryseobacterium sp. 2R14A TaxID=3380353 RepID=UPI003CECD576